MDWNAISAIGTIVASIVGIAGIWINLWEKTKRLSIQFFAVPCFKILICNSSLRTVAVTKVVYSLKGRPFHVEYFDGLHEMILPPASTQSISINKQDIYSSFYKTQMDAFSMPNDVIDVVVYDNYGRKYKKKTEMGISAFKTE